jgi:hypothetical protein
MFISWYRMYKVFHTSLKNSCCTITQMYCLVSNFRETLKRKRGSKFFKKSLGATEFYRKMGQK